MTTDLDYLRCVAIEPFDAARHDRSSFTCGVERIDNFLRITASKYVGSDSGRIYVAVERTGGRLVGFYALGPHAIDASSLDEDMRRRTPSYDRIPAFLLSMIAAHVDVRNRGFGGFMLADALRRCLRASDEIGGRFVVLDAISEDAARLYARYGFSPLASDPRRMVLGIAKIRASERIARTRGEGPQ